MIKAFLAAAQKIPTWVKVLAFFVYPIGTVLVLAYGVVSLLAKAGGTSGTTGSGAGTGSDGAAPDLHMQDEMNRQFNEWAMEESRKAVTPFDHGGYVQGDGFNPSDTMAADAARQAEQMNNMNNMNDMNMF